MKMKPVIPGSRTWAGTNRRRRARRAEDLKRCIFCNIHYSWKSSSSICSVCAQKLTHLYKYKGTIVQPEEVTSVKDPEDIFSGVEVYPNPGSDLINVNVTLKEKQALDIQLLSLDGKVIKQKTVDGFKGQQIIPLNVTEIPEGFYLVRLNVDEGTVAKKLVIK